MPKRSSVLSGREITKNQEDNYQKILAQMKQIEREGAQYHLKLAYNRGVIAQKILDGAQIFGKRKLADIAQDLGIKRLTLNQCIKFSKFLSKDTVESLCALPKPPSWRVMARWTGIKDEEKRNNILNKILNGVIYDSDVEMNIRTAIGLSSVPTPKRPKKLTTLIKKLNNEAQLLEKQIQWMQEELKKQDKVEDLEPTIEILATLKQAINSTLQLLNPGDE